MKPGTDKRSCQRSFRVPKEYKLPPLHIEKFDTEPVISLNHGLLLHDSELSRHTERVSHALKEYVFCAAENDKAWRKTSRFHDLYQHTKSIVGDWCSALDALDADQRLGWPIIHRLFISIEKLIDSKMCITSFLDLCFFVTRALVYSTHPGLLVMYLQQAERLAKRQLPDCPFGQIIASLRAVVESIGAEGLKTSGVLVVAAKVWADRLGQTRAILDRSALNASWDHIRMTSSADNMDTNATVNQWFAAWEDLFDMCVLNHGRLGPNTLMIQDDLMRLVCPSRLYPAEANVYLEKVVQQWRERLRFSHGIGSDENGVTGFFALQQ